MILLHSYTTKYAYIEEANMHHNIQHYTSTRALPTQFLFYPCLTSPPPEIIQSWILLFVIEDNSISLVTN